MSRRTIMAVSLALMGCASQWKVLGGPPECRVMCERWHLKFAGMVGVGNQDPREREGATACVCLDPEVATGAVSGAGGSSAGLSAPIAAAAQAAAAAAQQQALQQRSHAPHR